MRSRGAPMQDTHKDYLSPPNGTAPKIASTLAVLLLQSFHKFSSEEPHGLHQHVSRFLLTQKGIICLVTIGKCSMLREIRAKALNVVKADWLVQNARSENARHTPGQLREVVLSS